MRTLFNREYYLICIILQTFFVLKSITAQLQVHSKEIQSCLENKKKFFEEEISYGFFARDAGVFSTTVDKCVQYDPFIVGGTPASPKEFPPMARIGHYENNRTNWFCGGTLISSKYVLTAAHCFFSAYEVNIVRLGELDFSKSDEPSNPIDYMVKRLIKHPDYNDDELYNDIGLIELDRTVEFNSYRHPACLPITNGSEFPEFIAIGWGNTRFAGIPSEHLLKVKLTRFDDEQCKQIARKVSTEILNAGLNSSNQICAGHNSVAKDTCSGDSGGPLLVYHPQYPCMYYVVGVTSAGIENCGKPGVPGLYTRVYYYMDWIKSYIFN